MCQNFTIKINLFIIPVLHLKIPQISLLLSIGVGENKCKGSVLLLFSFHNHIYLCLKTFLLFVSMEFSCLLNSLSLSKPNSYNRPVLFLLIPHLFTSSDIIKQSTYKREKDINRSDNEQKLLTDWKSFEGEVEPTSVSSFLFAASAVFACVDNVL